MLAKRVRERDGLVGKGELQVGGTLRGRRLLLNQDGWRGAQIKRGREDLPQSSAGSHDLTEDHVEPAPVEDEYESSDENLNPVYEVK